MRSVVCPWFGRAAALGPLLLVWLFAFDAPPPAGAGEAAHSPQVALRGPQRLAPFDYQGVRLLDGRLKRQYDEVSQRFLALRPNDLLKGFRERAGLRAPGRELGGAYSNNALTFGQWLGAFARMYRITGDRRIRDRAVYLMDEWAKTLTDEPLTSHYVYDKLAGGLVDMLQYAEAPQARDYLDKLTAKAERDLDRSNLYALPTEWYTLAENLYRAYALTGDRRYREFAGVWEYPEYWGALAEGRSVFGDILTRNPRHQSYHAYSHVNTLSSAAMAYRVTGQRRYLDTCVNAYRFLQQTQCFATGGYGPEEQFVVPDGMPEMLEGRRRGESNVSIRFHFETACGSWAAFKLARYLMTFTGEAKYGDWIERLIYNGVGAMIPMNDDGMIMYGSKYHLRGAQKSLFTVWFCCTGTLPLDVAEYHNLIYFHDDRDVYVNLYTPSQLAWRLPEGRLTITQQTAFPEDERVLLRVEPQTPMQFALKLRTPLWSGGRMTVRVNDEPWRAAEPGQWTVIDRRWTAGDTVAVRFDLSPRIEPLPGYVSPVAVMAGPVVLVASTARAEEQHRPTEGPLRFPADWLISEGATIHRPVPDSLAAPLDRSRQLHTNQVFRPFYQLRGGEYYRMYFERGRSQIVAAEALARHGQWRREGDLLVSDQAGDYVEGRFRGSAVVWEGRRTERSGQAQVTIDGRQAGEADQYGYTGVFVPRLDQRDLPFRWSVQGLRGGEHTIRITVTGRSGPRSQGAAVNIRRLLSYP